MTAFILFTAAAAITAAVARAIIGAPVEPLNGFGRFAARLGYGVVFVARRKAPDAREVRV